MGNSSNPNSKEIQLLITHPNLPNSKIVNIQNQTFLKISVGLDEKEYLRWSQSLNKYVKNHSVILFPIKHLFSKTGFCGNSGTAQIYYDSFPYTLSEEIYNRNGRKTNFSQVQIWYLLFQLTKAKVQAKQIGQFLGDVRPKNIFLNQNGEVRVPSMSSWPNATNRFQKSIDKISTYLAPEDMKLIQLGSLQHGIGQQISQIFSIGLTLLSLGNLSDYEQLYDLKNSQFNLNKFNQQLLVWKRKLMYSQVLRSTVSNLSSTDPQKRMTIQQLWSLLSKHQQKINSKVNFVIDNAPMKLHEQVLNLKSTVHQNPILFMNSQLVSKIDGSGIVYPEYLQVQKVTPQYIFDSTVEPKQ